MSLSSERLHEVVSELTTRPRHEKVRALVYELLVNELGASSTEIDFERQVPEVRGRIDALLGRTLFEFKSDLRREQRDAENKLPDYLAQREAETGAKFIAVATDGATFIPYELRDGKLFRFDSFFTPAEKPHELLAWLSSIVAVNADLEPTSDVVKRELGKTSMAWAIAQRDLMSLWNEVRNRPGVHVKREIWEQLLRRVYGTALNEDILFLQHTYLTIIAKTMAAKVLGVPTSEPTNLLSGRGFSEVGIGGAVESDFFDWLFTSAKGTDLVSRIALQAERFRLVDVKTDVLKGLYESLIDPDQRHFLGEYYTPDWLAKRICDEAIERPLEQRVLDPACGSGTFLFHAVQRLLTFAEQSGMPAESAIELACRLVIGIDVHPVAVQIARVTFLLAIGQERLRHRPASINIPVYMGDSLQWNTRGFLVERDVLIEVPDSPELLEFPFEITRDPILFDAVIGRMLEMSQQNAQAAGLIAWLKRDYSLSASTLDTLSRTYDTLHQLDSSGQNHIWGFVARNLVRPIWLSQPSQKADVIVGNPPWLSYRFMDTQFQAMFRTECQSFGIWHGQVAQQQDLSAYFFVRCIELYAKDSGIIAFVMPYAAMTRRQFARFRRGLYGASQRGSSRLIYITLRFTDAWAFSDRVQPLFSVPSCVLFARSGNGEASRLPSKIKVVSGILPRRDASVSEADQSLAWSEDVWPIERVERVLQGYANRFRDGAVIFPSVLFRVQVIQVGSLGTSQEVPLVESRRTNQEKAPWKEMRSLRGNLEVKFLRPLYLGESIAPFRAFSPILSVVPWDDEQESLITAAEAQSRGYPHLASWLKDAEQKWTQCGSGRRTLLEQLDYFGQLSAQFPVASLRVVYAASGTLPAAAFINDTRGIVEHKLYWTKVTNQFEGSYLLAILNSETARKKAEHLQSRGQWGARDFDKVMLSLPIPSFNRNNNLHLKLARAAVRAEQVAASVVLREGIHFIHARQAIRTALRENGIDAKIDELVAELLNP
jgi:SAM-dependent methyltransferase